MMSIQAVIRSILINNQNITDYINDRIYDLILPRDITIPCLQLQRVSETIDQHTHARRTRMQIDCYGYNHTQTDALAEAVNSALIDASQSIDDINIQTIQHTNTLDIMDVDDRVYRVTQEYAVIWRYN